MFGSASFTGARVTRLIASLRYLGAAQAATSGEKLLSLWRVVGGPLEEIPDLLALLELLGLVRNDSQNLVARTSSGSKVAKAAARGDLSPFAQAVIRSGLLHDQVRAFLETGSTAIDGSFTCDARFLRARCAQLYGLLRMCPDVTVSSSVAVPKLLLDELTQIWAIIPPAENQEYLAERKKVGDRAELYSVNLERSRAVDPAHIAWVSRDSDSFGYDIEDRASVPSRCIEVKGRRDTDIVFFMSEHELSKARNFGPRYELHFWGMIDLARQPADEFLILRAAGYPHVFTDVASLIDQQALVATAVKWKLTATPP